MINEINIAGNKTICPVIALVCDNKLLIGLRHYTPDKWKTVSVWTFPGGRCDDGESIGTTLKREVAEETGITEFDIKKFLGVVPGAKDGDIVYIFFGKTKQIPKLLEPEKFSVWKYVEINNIPSNFINKDAIAIVKKELQ